MAGHRLDLAEARRIAVRAQLLAAPRPTDLLEVVERLTFLQLDPTAAIAPSADLVLWSRLGSSYRPDLLQQALEQERTLFEYNAVVRPMSDLRLYLADMATRPSYARGREWLRANDRFRRDILDRLGTSGPLMSRDIPDTSVVPWPSSGWTNDRNVTQMLELLGICGEIAVAGRIGRQRVWDLAERVYPADTPVVPAEEAHRIQNERRLRSLGIAREKGTAVPVEPNVVGRCRRASDGRGRARDVARGPTRRSASRSKDGLRCCRRSTACPMTGRARSSCSTSSTSSRCTSPRRKRRWGYFALPILHHDRLVGKLDATADRKSLDATRAGRPPGHPLHQHDDRRRRRRARSPGVVARPGIGRPRHDAVRASAGRS